MPPQRTLPYGHLGHSGPFEDGLNARQRQKARKRAAKLATGKHGANLAFQLEHALKKQYNRWSRWQLEASQTESKAYRYGVVWVQYMLARSKLAFPEQVIAKLEAAFNTVPQELGLNRQHFEDELLKARADGQVGPWDRVDDWFPKPKATPWKHDLQWWLGVSASFGAESEGRDAAGTAGGAMNDAYVDAGVVTGVTEAEAEDKMDVDDDRSGDSLLRGDLASVVAQMRGLQLQRREDFQ